MFTGIIQEVGKIVGIKKTKDNKDIKLTLSCAINQNIAIGASVAINGVCLTVVAKTIASQSQNLELTFDVSAHTANYSNLGLLQLDDLVNLETSLLLGDSLDGHFVYGHVDCTAIANTLTKQGDSWQLIIEVPAQYNKLLCKRGSIAIDGISLTIADLVVEIDKCYVHIVIIPHSKTNTIVDYYKNNQVVNIEFDMLARYVANSIKYAK